jgi:hypothetical protein
MAAKMNKNLRILEQKGNSKFAPGKMAHWHFRAATRLARGIHQM